MCTVYTCTLLAQAGNERPNRSLQYDLIKGSFEANICGTIERRRRQRRQSPRWLNVEGSVSGTLVHYLQTGRLSRKGTGGHGGTTFRHLRELPTLRACRAV